MLSKLIKLCEPMAAPLYNIPNILRTNGGTPGIQHHRLLPSKCRGKRCVGAVGVAGEVHGKNKQQERHRITPPFYVAVRRLCPLCP